MPPKTKEQPENEQGQEDTPDAPGNENGNNDTEQASSHSEGTNAPETSRVGSPTERVTAGGGKHVEVEHAEGYKYGQVVPNDESEEAKILRDRAQKASDAYYEGKEECPHCHVADGVRKGNNVCDSCGAKIRSGETEKVGDLSVSP